MLSTLNRVLNRLTKPPTQPEYRLINFGGSAAGIKLTPDESLRLSAVWRCVSLISQSVASLPWDVYRRDQNGNSSLLVNDPIAWLIGHEPNAEMTSFTFRQTMVQHVLLWGNAYAEIVRDARGRAIELHPLFPDYVEARRNANGTLYYRVMGVHGSLDLEARDVFHVPGMGFDGIRGYSVVEYALNALAGSRAVDEFSSRYFGQGARPSGIVKVGGEVQGERMDRLLETIQRWAHPKNAHKPIVLDSGMEWQQLTTNPDEAQMLETRRFNVIEICRIFGVPPHMAFDLEKSTQRNIETQNREFLAFGLNPRIIPLEQEANRKLLSSEFGGRHTRMNVNEFKRGDSESRSAYYQVMRNMGAFSVNDIRRMEGLDTIGPEGDVRVMQGQYVPLETIGEEPLSPPPQNDPELNGVNGAHHH